MMRKVGEVIGFFLIVSMIWLGLSFVPRGHGIGDQPDCVASGPTQFCD